MKNYYSDIIHYPSKRAITRIYEGLVKADKKQKMFLEESNEQYNRELRENQVSMEQVNKIADQIWSLDN